MLVLPFDCLFFDRNVDALTTITYISYAAKTFFKSYRRCNLRPLRVITSTFPTHASCTTKSQWLSYRDCPRFKF